jgi:hypothetical protein
MHAKARRGRAVVAAFLIQVWCAGKALAQPGPSVPDAGPSPDATRMVDVTIIAGGDDAEPLVGSLRELLGRLGLGVESHAVATAPAPPSPEATGLSVWVDLASRYEALTIVRHGRTEVRRTIPRDASPAIVREEISEAVRSAVEAELQAEEARTTPPPPPPVAPLAPAPPVVASENVPPPAPTSSRWFALDLTVLAGGGPVADGAWSARFGGGVVVGSRRRFRPSLAVTAAYFTPFNKSGEDSQSVTVDAQATFVSLRAVPSIEVVHVPWAGLNVGAGGGVDIISVTQPQTPQNVTIAAQSSTRGDPILTALATAYVELAPSVAFTIVAGTDVDFVPPDYAFKTFVNGNNPTTDHLLDPSPVRPFALAGFTFTALGSELFAARTP